MRTNYKQHLSIVKSQIALVLAQKRYEQADKEQLEYLIQLIDYVLLNKIPNTQETIITLMEELITTSVHQLNLKLLDLLPVLNEVKEELNESIA